MVDAGVAEQVVTGFSWTECPRWHDGALYFTDMYSARIIKIEGDGAWSVFADFSGREGVEDARVVIAGFGFLPDGRMIANSMLERLVLLWDAGDITVHADLRAVAPGPINDMVVDEAGRAYVTQIGYDVWKKEPAVLTYLLRIEPDGSIIEEREAGLLKAANGITISADGRTVVTAEAPEKRLMAFDRAEDGSLSNRRVFAQLELLPDGICFDGAGDVWAAQPGGGGALLVREGGELVDRVEVDAARAGRSTAVALGGPDRRTLHICCGFEVYDFDKSVREAQGSVWAAEVAVGAGGARP